MLKFFVTLLISLMLISGSYYGYCETFYEQLQEEIHHTRDNFKIIEQKLSQIEVMKMLDITENALKNHHPYNPKR